MAVKILLLSFAIRVLLSPIPGYAVDLSTFSAWFKTAAEHGPRVFYEATSFSDYPPFNVYIFWVFGHLAQSLSLFSKTSLVYVLKLPSNLFDMATSALIFVFLRRKLDFESSILAASFYAFNPATIFNTSIWGQFDAVYTFFLILTLVLILDSMTEYSVIAFTLAILCKPQSIALAPLIAFLIAKEKGWKGVVTSALISAATTFITIAPLGWSNPLDFLVEIYITGYGGYPFTSIYAFNVWAFHGFWEPDSGRLLFLNFFTVGWLMFGALTAFALYHLSKGIDERRDLRVLFTAFVLLFGFFMLPTRVHERYLFPVFSVLALAMPYSRDMKKIYGALSLTYLANQAYILSFLNKGEYLSSRDPFALTLTSFNVVTFLFTIRCTRLD